MKSSKNNQKLAKKSHNIRKVLPYYAKYKGLFIMFLTLTIASGALSILGPIFFANALATLAEAKFDDAIYFIILSVSIGIGRIITNGLSDFIYIKINFKVRQSLTEKVMDSITCTKMSKLDNVQLGLLSERISSDINNISDAYLNLLDLIFNILTNVVFLIYIAYLNVYIFLILLAYVAVLYIVCTIKSRVWIKGRKIGKAARDKAKSAYLEQIQANRDLKLLNLSDNITKYSSNILEDSLKIEQKVFNKRNLIRRIQILISAIFELVFLLIGIAFVKKEFLLLSGLLVIYTYYGKVESVVNYFSSFKETTAELETSASRIFEIVDEYEKESFGNYVLEDFSGKIEFKETSFAYSEGKEVLNGVNLEFLPGKITALVGKSGSGKTTVLSLISKLYETSGGEILFDGHNINELSKDSIRGNVSEVSQNPYIFNSSIKQNLLFVKPDATDDELENVLRQSQIFDDIKNMPNGIDTEIGEKGIKLSGGQKQRIAIARLLLTNTKVIAFDEATSALDNNNQGKIVELLGGLKNDHTIIIVAHRLSTIVNADVIYMIDDGKVIASGTHRELMKKCREYKELYSMEESSDNI